ncbi:pre-mRNA-splicing factor CWC25 homolog isoform X2 [Aricia agestis]|nr:pre-mRNA-splicing factor CWC25 homolog isoform X2 [Aricia agestis]
MGGGDLNSKKAWHPNTMKNQERVWKAEKAAAEEKKKILDLERERAQERDRDELNKLSKLSNRHSKDETQIDHQLHWMYNKPDKKGQNEDYLLGKSIEKNYDKETKPEQNEIPAVARRVVGSSMTTSTSDNLQVDLARKLREDPLLLVKERERAARAALLNNPIQRRKLTELLRKEQEQKKEKSEKSKKKTKKDLDEILTAKLSALGKGKLDLAKLLDSDDSSSDSSSEEEKKKIKKKKKKKDKKKKQKEEKCNSNSESNANERERENKAKSRHKKSDKRMNSSNDEDYSNSRKRYADNASDTDEAKRRYRRSSPGKKYDSNRYNKDKYHSSMNSYYTNERTLDRNHKKRTGLSEEEKAAKFAEMVAAGKEREVERSERVAKQRLEIAADERSANKPRYSNRSEARSLPDSLESRIHSNRHYIQRDHRHMNENFAKR